MGFLYPRESSSHPDAQYETESTKPTRMPIVGIGVDQTTVAQPATE